MRAAMVAAVFIAACHQFPEPLATPPKPYGAAVKSAWQSAPLAPLRPSCIDWFDRLRILVVDDARPYCGARDVAACCFKFYRKGFAWAADTYPTIIIHESRSFDGCAVHEATHIAAQCAGVPHLAHPAHLFRVGGSAGSVEERALDNVRR